MYYRHHDSHGREHKVVARADDNNVVGVCVNHLHQAVRPPSRAEQQDHRLALHKGEAAIVCKRARTCEEFVSEVAGLMLLCRQGYQ